MTANAATLGMTASVTALVLTSTFELMRPEFYTLPQGTRIAPLVLLALLCALELAFAVLFPELMSEPFSLG